jgi:hypothetical protein
MRLLGEIYIFIIHFAEYILMVGIRRVSFLAVTRSIPALSDAGRLR